MSAGYDREDADRSGRGVDLGHEKMFGPDDPNTQLLDRVEADVSKVDQAALQRLIEAAWGLAQHLDGIAEDLTAGG
jgi:hypothetical protein